MDLIDRQAIYDTVFARYPDSDVTQYSIGYADAINDVLKDIRYMPSAEPELLTDSEQRIFLAAMGREEEICKEMDKQYTREPYEDSLVHICREIKRKVKGALWT